MDIRTCGKPELDALNDRAKVWREQHSPNPDGIKDLSARPPQDQQAPAKDLSTLYQLANFFSFRLNQRSDRTAKREAKELAARQVFEREPGTGRNPPAARNLLQWDACDSFL